MERAVGGGVFAFPIRSARKIEEARGDREGGTLKKTTVDRGRPERSLSTTVRSQWTSVTELGVGKGKRTTFIAKRLGNIPILVTRERYLCERRERPESEWFSEWKGELQEGKPLDDLPRQRGWGEMR